MKFIFVVVLLLFGYTHGNSRFYCSGYCTCTSDGNVCKKGNVTVNFSLSDSDHLSIECMNSEKRGIELLPRFEISIYNVSIKKCNFQEYLESSSKGRFNLLNDGNSLIKLHIESNDVVQLEQNFFRYVRKLKQLEVVINSSSTEALAFNLDHINSTELKQITLINNGARRDLVNSKISRDLNKKSISHLKISGFKLKLVDFSLQNRFKCNKLDLSNNTLEFKFNSSYIINNIKDLIMKHNDIEGRNNLPDQLLFKLRSLENVSLSYNNLQSVHRDFFTQIRLKKLTMSHNYIKDISFIMPSSIIELDVSFNQIENINQYFSGLVNLKILNLSNNKISTISGKTFENLQLRKLYLDGNQINDNMLDETILDMKFSLNELEYLGLSNNSITKHSFHRMNAYTITVDLRQNKITFVIPETVIKPHNNTLLLDLLKYQKSCEPTNIQILESILKNNNFTKTEFQPARKLLHMLADKQTTELICSTDRCPANCECTIIQQDFLIGCSNSALKVFPELKPPEFYSNYTIDIDVSINSINELPRNLCSYNIKYFNASNNQITHIYDGNIPNNSLIFNVLQNPLENICDLGKKIIDLGRMTADIPQREPSKPISNGATSKLTPPSLSKTSIIALCSIIFGFYMTFSV